MSDDDRLTVRLGPEFADRLDAIAVLRGLKGRSEAVRSCIEEATAHVERRDPPRRHELLCILGEKARGGSTAAIRLLLEHMKDEPPEPEDVISRLAARRRERLGVRASDSIGTGEGNADPGSRGEVSEGFLNRPPGARTKERQ